MIKLTVLYGHPTDPAEFERYYREVHMPIVATMPNVVRYETARILPNPDGGQPTYYRSFEAWFESVETMQASRGSSQGQATAADLANFASGGVTILTAQIE